MGDGLRRMAGAGRAAVGINHRFMICVKKSLYVLMYTTNCGGVWPPKATNRMRIEPCPQERGSFRDVPR